MCDILAKEFYKIKRKENRAQRDAHSEADILCEGKQTSPLKFALAFVENISM
jgi:hypothetical protein